MPTFYTKRAMIGGRGLKPMDLYFEKNIIQRDDSKMGKVELGARTLHFLPMFFINMCNINFTHSIPFFCSKSIPIRNVHEGEII